MFPGSGFRPLPLPPLGVSPCPQGLPDRLVSASAAYFALGDETVLFSKRRRGAITLARWALAYTLINEVGWSRRRVAAFLNQDHSSTTAGCRQAEVLKRTDPVFFEALMLLREIVSPQ